MNSAISSIEFILNNTIPEPEDKAIIHNKLSRKNRIKLNKSQYEETKIYWCLLEYVGLKEDDGFDWVYKASSTELNNGLSAEIFQQIINSDSFFSNYIIKDNDLLTISLEYIHPAKYNKTRPYIGNYLSFIFNKVWEINSGYDHIANMYRKLQEGEVVVHYSEYRKRNV
ncbi:hypothetical protein [Elizabethkingia anophelis]|uniref:hypothetical protein n=1 Tax=Elizabethkingia anophelis TaxID=1117645 RepID=UPI0021A80885|nr:hypothetical protein [Elizabethkingia anophelis]MCT4207008.1 hypothetical protein [Elizabethkingia anophelis]MDV3750731.1 hypothetical protein [Elizabethkingia anophelis]MDV4099556.1 hypothetical protein [Elizabethkingia anophelis]